MNTTNQKGEDIRSGTVSAQRLHKGRFQKVIEAAMQKDVKDRIDDIASFLDEQTEAVMEYSET